MCTTHAHAAGAALSIVPATAVQVIGEPFTVELRVDTGGVAVGTVDATITYDPSSISFVSVSDSGSIFSTLLVDSSRAYGEIDLSALIQGADEPYAGTDGRIGMITFMPLEKTVTEVRIKQGSARSPLSLSASVATAKDILSNIQSATYTLVPRETLPPQGVLAAVGAAGAGEVTFEPAPQSSGWIGTSTVKVAWPLPTGVGAMRIGVSTSSTATPSKLYPVPVSATVLDGLSDGEQYLLLQYERGVSWGEVLAVPFKIDTTPPESVLVEPVLRDDGKVGKGYTIKATDRHSGVASYAIGLDGGELAAWERPDNGVFVPDVSVSVGVHTLTVSVVDVAGNSTNTDTLLNLAAIASPVLVSAPERVLTGDPIEVTGTTYPDAEVSVYVSFDGGDAREFTVRSDTGGAFSAELTEGARAGTYTVWFSVTDSSGAQSPLSLKRSIIATQPFIMLFGSRAVSYLSVIIPLVALVLLLCLVLWFALVYVRGYRRRVKRETREAYSVVNEEFEMLRKELVEQIGTLERAQLSRELTREEMRIFTELSRRLDTIEKRIAYEIADIERFEESVPAERNIDHETLQKYREGNGATDTHIVRSPKSKDPIHSPGHTVRIEAR
ncbi:MAG: hypothetical protein KBD21_03125 [Candidatus Pacebacteria bacterium]|nr:hypothetical protein [Candidatus Paceibacterota bacterium]